MSESDDAQSGMELMTDYLGYSYLSWLCFTAFCFGWSFDFRYYWIYLYAFEYPTELLVYWTVHIFWQVLETRLPMRISLSTAQIGNQIMPIIEFFMANSNR